MGAAKVDVDGVDQGFVEKFPSPGNAQSADYVGTGTAKKGRRQLVAIPPSASARTIGLTVTGGVGGSAVYAQLNKAPANGPLDTWAILGASREDIYGASRFVEDLVSSAFPGRDPLVFDWGKSSAGLPALQSYAAQIVAAYGGLLSHALIGNCITNSWTLPYASDPGLAAIEAGQRAIINTFKVAGYRTFASNITFRTTSGNTPEAQGIGHPYNVGIIELVTAELLSECYDADLGRSRWDAELVTQRWRAALQDDRHPTETLSNIEVAYLADQVFRRVYTGAWGTPYAEQLVAVAEASLGLDDYAEAANALRALKASPAKSALNARVVAVYPAAMRATALAKVQLAEASPTQQSVADANSAIDAAEAAGAAVSDLRARVAQLVISASKTIKIGLGFGISSSELAAGWNQVNGGGAAGTVTNGLLDDQGGATDVTLTVSNAGTSRYGGQTPSNVSQVPSAILANGQGDSAGTLGFKLGGPSWIGKKVDFLFMGSRAGTTGRTTRFILDGKVVGFNAGEHVTGGNTGDFTTATKFEPDANGYVNILASRGTGNTSYTHLNAIVATVHA
ncbi:hypothetical protein [Sphingomonas sp. S2-65]|uniref:hypothetical protein n=1 Tax=Sphingomonas sp. S2-65 TaxID=2903960 RepID=UPI001F2D2F6E|nr:hypothetical protein [Sphingomonas sp. S2-65]UYY60089.1 hypothetical protein LZ586_08435 [Sphingomonas sp. S2-65]